MKKKIILLIALTLLVPSIAFAVVSCPPPGSFNTRPVAIGQAPYNEQPLQTILTGEGGFNGVNANSDQQTASMWSFVANSAMTIRLSAAYAGFKNYFGIWSCNSTPVDIFKGVNNLTPPGIEATLIWDSSGNLTISGGSYVNNGTFTGISRCSFGFFLRNPSAITFYTLDSLNNLGEAHALAYKHPNSDKWAIAFEDTPFSSGDEDYNDLVVIIDSMNAEQQDTDGDRICDFVDNCPKDYNPDQADWNDDGLGDACSGGPETKYVLEVPPAPVPYGSEISATATFINDTGHDILIPKNECFFNVTFTVRDESGNALTPGDRIRAPYRIGPPNSPNSDLVIIPQGESFTNICKLSEIFSPQVLVPGSYTVQATYSNYIQDPCLPGEDCLNLSMVAIKSNEPTLNIYQYTFSGFFSPVVNLPKVNIWKAGSSAVPVKWKITDPNGAVISDPNSFAGLYSYQASCTDWSPTGPEILESVTGASGLRYMGDGKWQYNWNTSVTYRGTCRMMVLKLNDNSTHTARFQFK